MRISIGKIVNFYQKKCIQIMSYLIDLRILKIFVGSIDIKCIIIAVNWCTNPDVGVHFTGEDVYFLPVKTRCNSFSILLTTFESKSD